MISLYPASISALVPVARPSVRSPSLLLAVLHSPRPLSAFVAFVAWPDLYSLLSTCSALRSALFAHLSTRDVLLARFVPGYAFCLAHRDMQFFQDVPITVHDLDLLLISNRTDLHRYPTHALRTLTAPALPRPDSAAKLIKLTQAHSRFVLLFQSLVHSSTTPIPPDPPEDRFSLKSPDPSPQLTFPPPLAFTIDSPPPPPPKDLSTPRRKHKHSYSYTPRHISRKSSASPYMIAPSNSSPLSHPYDPSISSTQSLPARSKQKSNRCLSIFCMSEPTTVPPPPEEPQTLQILSKEWRRARSASIISTSGYSPSPRTPLPSFTKRPNHSSSLDFGIYLNSSYPSDTDFEFGQLRRPRRLFAPEQQPSSSSSSSISFSETRSSWNQGQGSISSSRSSPPVSPHGYTPPRVPLQSNRNGYNPPFAPSIHSLLHATIRNRAPILRVFVPTQHMLPPDGGGGADTPTPRSSPERNQISPQTISSLTIQACEAQLQEAGLWDHLSTGDVICNFGYIPLDDNNPSSSSIGGDFIPNPSFPPGLSDSVYTPKVLSPSHRPSLRSFTQPHPQSQAQHRKTWLIFTGHSLLPYTPPSLLPLFSSSPLTLPSPFYYYHILPQGTNPLFEIPQLPPLSSSSISFSLIKTTSLIPSTISHTGFAKVNKFAWTARVVRSRPQVQSKNPFGSLFNPNHDPDPTSKPLPTIPQPSPPPELSPFEQLGDGWIGEWVVEYEGTSEGRQVLLAALEGKKELGKGVGRKIWEVRRERSGGGRVWMRLLPE